MKPQEFLTKLEQCTQYPLSEWSAQLGVVNPAPATAADFEETQSPITPTRNGVRPNPTYAAAGKLLRLANVAIRQHTPSASVDVTYW